MEISVFVGGLGLGIAIGIAIGRAFRVSAVDVMRHEVERLHMQLSACGVAALAITPADVGKRLNRDSPYWNPAYDEVCRAVDREMRLRVARDSEVFQFIGWLSGDIEELHRVEVPRLAESWARFQSAQAIDRAGEPAVAGGSSDPPNVMPAGPWQQRWYGSPPERGDSIFCHGERIAYLGDQHHDDVSRLVLAHNLAVAETVRGGS